MITPMAKTKPKPKRGRGVLIAAVSGLGVGTIAAVGLYLGKPAHEQPLTTASVPTQGHRPAMVVTPEGNGNCRRLFLSNDMQRTIDAGVVPCAAATTGGSRDAVPPVMRGYQEALGKR